MRKVADVIKDNDPTLRLMIYSVSKEETYLFGYEKETDSPSDWDLHFEKVEEAYQHAIDEYEIEQRDWHTIPDPLEGCQHDWINPVRRIETADPEERKFEALENDEWKAIEL